MLMLACMTSLPRWMLFRMTRHPMTSGPNCGQLALMTGNLTTSYIPSNAHTKRREPTRTHATSRAQCKQIKWLTPILRSLYNLRR